MLNAALKGGKDRNIYKYSEWLVIILNTIYNAFKNSLAVCLFSQHWNYCLWRDVSFIPFKSNAKAILNHDKIIWHESITSIILSIFISRSLGQIPISCHIFYFNILFINTMYTWYWGFTVLFNPCIGCVNHGGVSVQCHRQMDGTSGWVVNT